MNSKYYLSLVEDDKKQYCKKLTLTSGDILPDPFMLNEGWTDNITNLPSIGYRDVTEYLIDTPSHFTKEALKAYKSLEAYNYFICGHVQDCYYHKIVENTQQWGFLLY